MGLSQSGDLFSPMKPLKGTGTISGCEQTFGINRPLDSTVITCGRTCELVELTLDPMSNLPEKFAKDNSQVTLFKVVDEAFAPQPLNYVCEYAASCPHAGRERQ